MRKVLVCVAIASVSVTVYANDTVTFTKDVLPILQENCITCHRPAGANLSGMIAPMSLMTYREVRPWAKAIRTAVVEGVMPPWHASDATHGKFKNERTLTEQEVDTIRKWVDSGAARGNPEDAPPPMEFPESGWSIGEPDLVLEFDEPYWVADDVEDIQPRIPITLTEDVLPEPRWVKAVEFKPGSEVVHHLVAYTYPEGEETDPRARRVFGRLAPGTDPQIYEDGYGVQIRPGSKIMLSMHYHKEPGPGTGQWDSSKLALRFHDEPVIHPIESSTIAHGDFEIPPFHSNWKVGGSRTFPEAIIVLDYLPHMHLRGSSAKYTAYYPDGTSELLLEVPRYDYNWQTAYEYKQYKRMPAGTRIEWEITYDNSEANALENGFNAGRAVRFGGPTTDEMDLGWMTFALQEPNKYPNRLGLNPQLEVGEDEPEETSTD